MKKLYRFKWDFGRMGELDGIFTAEDYDLENLFGKNIYFGEVLGKHSEIYGILKKDDIEVLSDDEGFIDEFRENLGEGTISGFNPLDHLDEV